MATRPAKRRASSLGAALGLALTLAAGCPRGNGPKPPPAKPARGVVVFHVKGRSIRVAVEIARTPEKRSRGLMHRKQLGKREGMLFDFERDAVQSFWMHNTYIPLDMVFVNSAMRVVGVVENAEPLTDSSRTVGVPSRYVVEVNAGFCEVHGIGKGTRVELLAPR